MLVPKVNRFLGIPFGTGRRVTQGDPASPMMFNIMVNEVVGALLEVVCAPQDTRHDMGWAVGERNLVFYVDDRRIGGREYIWVQDALTASVAMIRRMGLKTKLKKTKTLVCTPGTSGGGGVMRPTSAEPP